MLDINQFKKYKYYPQFSDGIYPFTQNFRMI